MLGPSGGPPAAAPAGAIQPAGGQNLATNEQVLFEGEPALVSSIGIVFLLLFTAGLAAIWLYFRRGGVRYKITTQRVVIDRGIFSKTMEQLDLYRINDFTVDRPFGQRLLGTGNIRLTTFDKTTPIVTLEHLKTDVVKLYETLRVAVETAKQSRGVRVLDME
jgi:uncharacterized membrane protein YdbT with pleckstrin-like domain